MSSQLFQLLADQIMGTNISGLNQQKGPGYEPITPELRAEVEKLYRAYQDLDVAHRDANEVLSVSRDMLRERLAEINEAHALREQVHDRLSAVHSESRRLSQAARIENFITVRGEAYLKSIGKPVGIGTFRDIISKLNRDERFTFNIYVLAAADYLVFETTLSNMLLAVEEVVEEYKSGQREIGDGLELAKLIATCDHLMKASVHLSRLDQDVFKSWFKERAKQYAKHLRVDEKTGELLLENVPKAKFFGIEELSLAPQTVADVHSKLPEVARQYVGNNVVDELFPPAYKSESFNLAHKIMPVL